MTSNPPSSLVSGLKPVSGTTSYTGVIRDAGGPRACSRCMFGLHSECADRVAYPGQPERECACCGAKP